MTNDGLRLISLTYAFPPGLSGRFPSLRTAAHATETRAVQALSRLAEVSTIGWMPKEMWQRLEPRDDSLGLEHELLLWNRRPELWHHWRAWRQLRRFYLEKTARAGMPDVILVWNMTAIYNYFVRWLRQQPRRPIIVLILADSGLGERIPTVRRLRYWLKPMQMLEDRAVKLFDACIAFSSETQRYFEPRGVPWMWMPSAFNFVYDPPSVTALGDGPIRFGYFGGLSKQAAVLTLVRTFLSANVPGTLHMCGHGVLAGVLNELAGQHANFQFDGLLPKQSDCLPWAQQVDVLVNPRLPFHGQVNTFPSKIFEFGVTGKAILSTRTGGVDRVLQDEGFYLETENFEDSLRRKIREVAGIDRAELRRRGTAIRNRILKDFNWDTQAQRMIEFLTGLVRAAKAR